MKLFQRRASAGTAMTAPRVMAARATRRCRAAPQAAAAAPVSAPVGLLPRAPAAAAGAGAQARGYAPLRLRPRPPGPPSCAGAHKLPAPDASSRRARGRRPLPAAPTRAGAGQPLATPARGQVMHGEWRSCQRQEASRAIECVRRCWPPAAIAGRLQPHALRAHQHRTPAAPQ